MKAKENDFDGDNKRAYDLDESEFIDKGKKAASNGGVSLLGVRGRRMLTFIVKARLLPEIPSRSPWALTKTGLA